MHPGDEQAYASDVEATTGADPVEAWRLHVLIEAGFPVYLAEKLAASAADLHRAVALVKAGCRYQTAAEILL